jgi:hypothetical protein
MKASGWLLFVALIAAVGIGGFAWYRFEGEPPGLEAPDAELVIGRAGVKVDLHATDAGSGLRSLRVAVAQPGAPSRCCSTSRIRAICSRAARAASRPRRSSSIPRRSAR